MLFKDQVFLDIEKVPLTFTLSPWKKTDLKLKRTEFCLDALDRDFEAANALNFKTQAVGKTGTLFF